MEWLLCVEYSIYNMLWNVLSRHTIESICTDLDTDTDTDTEHITARLWSRLNGVLGKDLPCRKDYCPVECCQLFQTEAEIKTRR